MKISLRPALVLALALVLVLPATALAAAPAVTTGKATDVSPNAA